MHPYYNIYININTRQRYYTHIIVLRHPLQEPDLKLWFHWWWSFVTGVLPRKFTQYAFNLLYLIQRAQCPTDVDAMTSHPFPRVIYAKSLLYYYAVIVIVVIVLRHLATTHLPSHNIYSLQSNQNQRKKNIQHIYYIFFKC